MMLCRKVVTSSKISSRVVVTCCIVVTRNIQTDTTAAISSVNENHVNSMLSSSSSLRQESTSSTSSSSSSAGEQFHVEPKYYYQNNNNNNNCPVWSNSLSFTSPETDFCVNAAPIDVIKKLPRTLAEAMSNYNNKHAIVVTTSTHPYKIIYVNKAWEDLCGYNHNEVCQQTLKILQGKDTNVDYVKKMVKEIANNDNNNNNNNKNNNKPIDIYTINYKKDGTSFKNHVTMGPMIMSEQESDIKLLVGILEEVDNVPLRLINVD